MSTRVSALVFLLAVAVCMPTLSASYIKFDGVDGESTSKKHKGWIEVLSVSDVVAPRDSASGMATGKRQHKPITITKQMDKSSPQLAKALSDGTHLTNVTINVDGQITVLKSARIVSIDRDRSGNEIISLSPGNSPEEAKKGNVDASWKVEEGTK